MTGPTDERAGVSAAPGEFVVEATDIKSAVAEAARRFGCIERQIRYVVLQEPSAGFLGFWIRPARIRAWRHDSLQRQVDEALKAVKDMDGHYLIEIESVDLLLTVHAPLGAAKPVAEDVVMKGLREYTPEFLDEAAVIKTVREGAGKPVVVGRLARAGEKDGRCEIRVAPDAMSADMVLFAPKKGGKPVELRDVERALVRAGVVHGIRMEIVEKMVREERCHDPIRIAEGTPAEEGIAGRLDFLFRTDRHVISLAEDEKGRVDYRELDLIESVKKGELLVRREPPRAGTPGRDVLGKPVLSRPGPDVELPAGENVSCAGDQLISGLDGHVTFVGNRVMVTPVYHVKGDVNYETGNIDFNGTVYVDGLIEDAFTVKAAGSLFVKKSIGKCHVEVGGNLVVMGGILGRQEATISVGGDLVALFIEHARVNVGGNLIVSELILHSEAAVGGELLMNGARATLVGGAVRTGRDVTVRSIGGEGTTRTHVRAGVTVDLAERQASTREEAKSSEEMIARIDDALRQIQSRTPDADAGIEAKAAQLKERRAHLHARLRGLRETMKHIETEIDEASVRATINVHETAMAGTRIEIGCTSTVLSSSIKYVTFKKFAGKVNVYPYSGRTPDKTV